MNDLKTDLRKFLLKFQYLFNFSNVEIFSHLRDFDPKFINDLEKVEFEGLKKILLNGKSGNFEILSDFCEERINLELKIARFVIKYQEENVANFDFDDEIFKKMNPKKIHEIRRFSTFISDKFSGENLAIVDLGAGLGYLDQAILSLNKRVKIVAVESNLKIHRGNSRRISGPNVVRINQELNFDNYANFLDNLNFGDDAEFAIIGLHCCGNLTNLALKMFGEHEKARILSLVPCCYHKGDPIENFNGPSMRLASQESFRKWVQKSNEELLQNSKNFGFRAIFEKFCSENDLKYVKTKRRVKNGSNFENFISGYQVENLDKEALLAECEANCDKFELLEKINGIQLSLQNLLEFLVLLEKCEHLLEENADDVIFYEIFDKESSPRNYLIYCSK